ncbi:MAG TPA: DUF3696 domain-containing protein [Candidatus Nanopelagicales bacterium]|nr:DUF3696 domain-containing protein [Candidatus Nanopelagicales bacterium]
MLSAITLDGFRCFAETTRVTFGSLTVLAGANSAGKSSVILALLSLVQSQQQPPSPGLIRLSGEWVELGSFRQVLSFSRQGEDSSFKIGVSGRIGDQDTDMLLTLADPGESARDAARIGRLDAYFDDDEWIIVPDSPPMFRVVKKSQPAHDHQMLGGHPWNFGVLKAGGRGFHEGGLLPHGPESVLYLSAFRDLPRSFYPRRRSKLGPLLGAMGEHVAEVLFTKRNEVTDIVPVPGPSRLLGSALEAWWSHVFGGDYSIRAEAAEELGFTLSLDTPSAESLRLTQVGTGLSQALPVIVLGLCSKPGDLVIVESPEVQLHPAAQHRLMDLFSALARSGRQVILETHSDHIVHAAQLAVKKKKLAAEEVAMRFFSQEEGAARVEEIPIDEHGRMHKQPIGFVDQASADLLELIR